MTGMRSHTDHQSWLDWWRSQAPGGPADHRAAGSPPGEVAGNDDSRNHLRLDTEPSWTVVKEKIQSIVPNPTSFESRPVRRRPGTIAGGEVSSADRH
jgi:hypothetical protein